MKKIGSVILFAFLCSFGGFVSAAEIIVSESFPEGHVLNPASAEDAVIFGDVRATIVSNELDSEDTRTVQIEIENSLRTSLWIEPTYLMIFEEGRYLGDARVDDGAEAFSIVSMETDNGSADIAYEWYMAITPGGSGVITLQMSGEVEKLCYKPFASNAYGLLEDEDTRIHGRWMLMTDQE